MHYKKWCFVKYFEKKINIHVLIIQLLDYITYNVICNKHFILYLIQN